nr:hypothetical protein [Pseudomonadota bacterium]
MVNDADFTELALRLSALHTEESIMKTIKAFMSNSELYHDIILENYVKENNATVQELYLTAIKELNASFQYTRDAGNCQDQDTKASFYKLADESAETAKDLLNQYNCYKLALAEDFEPHHANMRAKTDVDAYLNGLDDSPALTDYKFFVIAYHYAKTTHNRSPEGQVAEKALRFLQDKLPQSDTAMLSDMY